MIKHANLPTNMITDKKTAFFRQPLHKIYESDLCDHKALANGLEAREKMSFSKQVPKWHL